MRLTPLDIRKQPFRKTLYGFDKDHVNTFLDMVATEFEQLVKKNNELSNQVKVLQGKNEHYATIEKTLNDTLMTAQEAAEKAKTNATKEAELIIKDAQLRANKIEERSRQNVNKLDADFQTLRIQRDSFLSRLRSLVNDHMVILDSMTENFESESEKKMYQSQSLVREKRNISEANN